MGQLPTRYSGLDLISLTSTLTEFFDIFLFIIIIQNCLICSFKDVERASESNAIEILLITDELFRLALSYEL